MPPNEAMFVQATGIAPIPLAVAKGALDRAVHDGGLIRESRRACDEADAFLMRVRPGQQSGLTKQVRVHVLPPHQVGRVLTVGFRWEATGPGGRLFPTVDGDLTLSPAEADATTVTVTATYRPPLGRLGDSLDRTLLTGVADATMAALVQAVITKLVAGSEPNAETTMP